jgi:hypothetical protein
VKTWLDRYGFWIALLIASAAYFHRFSTSTDLGIALYMQAARCLLYDQVMPTCALYFTYPPALAFIMLPLTPLPALLQMLIWYAITIAASVGMYKLAERIASRMFADSFGAEELLWVRVIAVILSLKFVLAVFENQSHDALTGILILFGLASLADGHEKTAGGALGIAAAIKATPLIFLPYLIVKKRFIAAAIFTIIMLAVSFLPDLFFTPAGGSEGYFLGWLHHIAGPSLSIDPGAALLKFWAGANAFNHSLRGAVSLQIDEMAYPALHKAVLYGLDIAFIAFAALLIMVRKPARNMIAVDGSILIIGILMLSPMTSRSHYVLLVLPYVTLTMVMLRDQVTRGIGIAVLAVSFVFLTVTSNDVVGKRLSDYAYFHSHLVIGALTLMIYIAVIVWNPAVLRNAKPFALQVLKLRRT